MSFGSFSGSGQNPPGGMTPADDQGGGFTQTNRANGMMDQSGQAYNVYFDQMYRPGMNSDTIREQFYAMTPEQQASYATPGNKYAGIGFALSGGTQPMPGMPNGQYPNLMQNPAFNPVTAPTQTPIPTPPALAEQIASPAPGAQQLINQLTPPPPQPALTPPPQPPAPQIQPPQPVQQQPFSYAAPELKFAPPPPVNMEFLRQPGATPPPPASAPFSPPPRVNMDFLRAPVAQPAPAARMPTQATQGYVSRVPARGAYIAPKAPAPAPKPVAKPVAKPNPFKPVAKAPARPVKR